MTKELQELQEIPATTIDDIPDLGTITQEQLTKIDEAMRHIEDYETFLAIAWGYRFYIMTEPDGKGVMGYEKLGLDIHTANEYVDTFKSTSRPTAYKKKQLYELWARYLFKLPFKFFCNLGWTKILTIKDKIIEYKDDEKKLTSLLEEANDSYRRELEFKYKDRIPKVVCESVCTGISFDSKRRATITLQYTTFPFDFSTDSMRKLLYMKKIKGILEIGNDTKDHSSR